MSDLDIRGGGRCQIRGCAEMTCLQTCAHTVKYDQKDEAVHARTGADVHLYTSEDVRRHDICHPRG